MADNKSYLDRLKKKLGLTGALLLAGATLSPNTANAEEVTDTKNKIELTTTPKDYIVVDTATMEGVLTAQNEKEAQKLLNHYARKYVKDKEILPSRLEKILKEFSGQEYLLLETIKNDMKPHKHTIRPFADLGDNTKYTFIKPGPKKMPFDSFRFFVGGEEEINIDYLRTIVNAKDVFEKSGLNLLNPLPSEKKLFSDEGLLDMLKNRVNGDNYGVDMQVNKETGRLNGVSTIRKFDGEKSEIIANLKYDNGKFIGGDVNGKPIRAFDASKQMATQKALNELQQSL
ncbi:MAG: hypothetical protein IKR92_01545 [Alphaproteobacteria bacterium]|nr:hypothetical protein [Alphaproteobacteria bacterium]